MEPVVQGSVAETMSRVKEDMESLGLLQGDAESNK